MYDNSRIIGGLMLHFNGDEVEIEADGEDPDGEKKEKTVAEKRLELAVGHGIFLGD